MSEQESIIELLNQAKTVKNQWQSNVSYKEKMNIPSEAERSVDFYEGRQWQKFKKKFPFEKPIFNLVEFVHDSKRSNILSKTWKFNFVVNNDMLSTKKVSDFAEFQTKEMQLSTKLRQCVSDGLLKGTYVLIFYWDEDAEGELGRIKGALRCDVIDVNDIAVANPAERDIQKQEWIIYRTRETVESVKEMCETLTDEEKKNYIKADSFTPTYNTTKEQSPEDTISVYVKMWKKDGEVYFQRFTDSVVITQPMCLNPNVNVNLIKKKESKNANVDTKKENTYEQDNPSGALSDSTTKKPTPKIKANLYPIEMNFFRSREKSCYGRSDVVQLIPNNMLINQQICMNMLYSMKTAVNTVVVKAGALGTQIIDPTNPGQIITDYSPIGTNGIQYLNNQSVPTTTFELATSVLELTKNLTRSTDVLTSEVVTKDLSGTAIAQLQGQQDKPIEQYQNALWESLGRIGKILEMFYKLFYKNAKYTYVADDLERINYMEQQNLDPNIESALMQESTFNGEDYTDTPFTVQVEVGEGTKFSELMTLQVLNDLYLSGSYSNMSVDQKIQWATMLPKSYFAKKDEFIRLLEKEKVGVVAQLSGQVEQLKSQIEQQASNTQNMYEEFTKKINLYNDTISKLKASQQKSQGTA